MTTAKMENPFKNATKAAASVEVAFTSPEFDHWTDGEGNICFREIEDGFFTAKNKGRVIAKRKTQKGIESAINRWSEKERERQGVDMFITVIEEV